MLGELNLTAASARIKSGRKRTNILKHSEFKTIEFLCKKMPSWVTPDILTTIGLLGSLVVGLALFMSIKQPLFLLLAIVGFAIQWFGDSLDGRLAYYRNTPRKWYGWVLDLNADWISISLIGLGFYSYLPEYKFLAFIFVLAYGGSMILSLLRYKINNKYQIDKGIFGPTEIRIIICIILIMEFFLPGALTVFCAIGSLTLIVMNVMESLEVINLGDIRDKDEKCL